MGKEEEGVEEDTGRENGEYFIAAERGEKTDQRLR